MNSQEIIDKVLNSLIANGFDHEDAKAYFKKLNFDLLKDLGFISEEEKIVLKNSQ